MKLNGSKWHHKENSTRILDELGQTVARAFCIVPVEGNPKPIREIHESEQKKNADLIAAAPDMEKALAPVFDEIDEAIGARQVYFDKSFNPEYEITINLSIQECRDIINAMKKAGHSF